MVKPVALKGAVMTFRRAKVSPYFLIFLVPVALFILLAGGLNLASFYSLREGQRVATAQQAADNQRVAAATSSCCRKAK